MEKRGCLSLVLGIALVGSMFGNLMLLVLFLVTIAASEEGNTTLSPIRFDERVVQKAVSSEDKIAVISIRGVIASSEEGHSGESMVEETKYALQQALEDKAVKAIILSIDSPGGEVTASDVLYHAVKVAREKKPVVIYMNSMAASGGYYIACAGTHLMASNTTWTGSIGVIIQTMNYRELLGKVGLSSVVFKSGKFKDMMNGAREMTEDEKAYMQKMVMQSYGRFVGIVANERKLDEKTLREGIADGRIISGEDALEAKLIDEIGYIEDAYDRARKLGNANGAAVVEYRPSYGFAKLFQIFGKASKPQKVELSLNGSVGLNLQPGRWYYLPGHLVP